MTMGWFEPVMAYCERTGPGVWAEPVNAASNLAFLLAAAASARRARAVEPPDRACLGLAGLIAVVGIGSFLFHTLAVTWAMYADIIPITLFIVAYLALALHRFLNLPRLRVEAATAGFVLFSFTLVPTLDGLSGSDISALTNGSIDYLPAALALFTVAALDRPETRFVGTGRRLTEIGVLFLVSLTARTLDRSVCAVLPMGTHALWHGLNALVLYALVATAIRHRAVLG
ncbi:ceramidase domain-containing protein [Methylobacterium sp. J-048]|uniref:ceramidase domain-containing protein n=1 Tax=Methylobacterium sp. J-048 TaxID=2836635 RepID=UPI001FBBDD83|nr:ceramidase domain-containing protein [Methylobacterium sp. J-048]MCJ2057029.1 ceramidase domain-containing protein [Methylobacterium sp. J-048]